jgi:hypothetical protein
MVKQDKRPVADSQLQQEGKRKKEEEETIISEKG